MDFFLHFALEEWFDHLHVYTNIGESVDFIHSNGKTNVAHRSRRRWI